jgi:hypothetical protein
MKSVLPQTGVKLSRERAMARIFLLALALLIAASTAVEVRTFAEFTVADSGE